jgi:hypothetical protein
MMNVQYPMLFELQNPNTNQLTHCGVLEFTAEEGNVYIPYWMMQLLFLEEGDFIHVRNVTLPRATYVKLQPHETAFIDIANPKAVLEIAFRNFSCLTRGDVIQVQYNDRKYDLNVVDVKPNTYGAVSIVETDVQLDFDAPVDYVEPPKPAVAAAAASSSSAAAASSTAAATTSSAASSSSAVDQPAGKRLRAESSGGAGYVLNGKSSSKTTSTAAPVAVVSNKPKRFRTMLVNGALVREEIPDSDDDDDDTDSSSSDDGKPAAAAPVADAASPANHFASLQGGHVLRPTKKK